jgi:hypothetical protein
MATKMTGSKADGVNFTEIRANALGSLGGGEPVSIRKRGYHRALKSGKQWALYKKSWNDLLNNFCTDFYAPVMQAYILTENPFLKMQGLSQWLPKEKSTIKIEYGTEYFGLDRTAKTRFDLPPPPSLWSRLKTLFSF